MMGINPAPPRLNEVSINVMGVEVPTGRPGTAPEGVGRMGVGTLMIFCP